AVVFTAVDKILLEPLPYKNPGDLYMVLEATGKGCCSAVLTGPVAANLQKVGGLIEGAAAMQNTPLTLPVGAQTEAMRITGLETTPNLFDMLGVRPALGRVFRAEETGPDSRDVIVLSDGLWKR